MLNACGGKNSPRATYLAPLNDTGVNFCRDLNGSAVPCSISLRQDGNSGRDAASDLHKVGAGPFGFDWTKLDHNGEPLKNQNQTWDDHGSVSEGTQWACIRDNHTGLVWEVKSSTASALNYHDYQYQWFNPIPESNGGYSGDEGTEMCGSVLCNTHAFVNAMNDRRWCGATHWQLPSVNDMLSLVITSQLNLVLDPHYFPHAKAIHYWTRQSYAPLKTHAWYLYFSDGSPSSTLKSKPMFLRLVSYSAERVSYSEERTSAEVEAFSKAEKSSVQKGHAQ